MLVTLLLAVSAAPLVAGPPAAAVVPLARDLSASEPFSMLALGAVLALAAAVLRVRPTDDHAR